MFIWNFFDHKRPRCTSPTWTVMNICVCVCICKCFIWSFVLLMCCLCQYDFLLLQGMLNLTSFMFLYIKCKSRVVKWKSCGFILSLIIILMLLCHVRLYYPFYLLRLSIMQCPVRHTVLLWVVCWLFILTVHLSEPWYKLFILILHCSALGYIIYIDSTFQCIRIHCWYW